MSQAMLAQRHLNKLTNTAMWIIGMNSSEAEHFGKGPARPMPCQALDHTAGFMLSTGIVSALYKRLTEGGSYEVNVSLAGCMKYLRSLGQYEGRHGFECEDIVDKDQIGDLLETGLSAFGKMRYVRHSAHIDGIEVGSRRMPVVLGTDTPVWK